MMLHRCTMHNLARLTMNNIIHTLYSTPDGTQNNNNKNSLFLYLKWWGAQQDFSQLLTNKSVRATCTTVIYNRMNIICIYKT